MLLNTIGAISVAILVEKLKGAIEKEQNTGRDLFEKHRLLRLEVEQRKKIEEENSVAAGDFVLTGDEHILFVDDEEP